MCDGCRRGFDQPGASVPGRPGRSDRDRLCERHCGSRGEGSRRQRGRRKPAAADTKNTGPGSGGHTSRGLATIVTCSFRRFRRGTAAADPGADRGAANRPGRGAFTNARDDSVGDTCNSKRRPTGRSFHVPNISNSDRRRGVVHGIGADSRGLDACGFRSRAIDFFSIGSAAACANIEADSDSSGGTAAGPSDHASTGGDRRPVAVTRRHCRQPATKIRTRYEGNRYGRCTNQRPQA